ncbi:hypothetical protein [Mycobacterium avium]|uniref:hypothetical protein n=1 Tax=Mycobacterium avium TaxID=1764 RepID=UPI001157E398|nr:hypothetical protein [Mycobacterium avium]
MRFVEISRGRCAYAAYVVALAVMTAVGCGNKDSKPSPAYQRGYDVGQSDAVRRLIQQGELPIRACDETLRADQAAQSYSFDDAGVYKQGCLDAVHAQGISPNSHS